VTGQFDLDFSRAARDDGIKRAAEHAGAQWMKDAIEDFADFLRTRGEATLEQWRYDWLARGNPQPPSHKAYGAVASAAARAGKAVNTQRYVKATSLKTHAHPVPIWRAP
jgi:hypothetical protein